MSSPPLFNQQHVLQVFILVLVFIVHFVQLLKMRKTQWKSKGWGKNGGKYLHVGLHVHPDGGKHLAKHFYGGKTHSKRVIVREFEVNSPTRRTTSCDAFRNLSVSIFELSKSGNSCLSFVKNVIFPFSRLELPLERHSHLSDNWKQSSPNNRRGSSRRVLYAGKDK